ncbi:MAG TPA: Yip1 family protein [Pseudomonadales bacterium]
MRTFLNGFLITVAPDRGWRSVRADAPSVLRILLLHTLPFALVPAVSWYLGVTTRGWTIAGEPMRLTAESALPMCVLFYGAMIAGVLFLGFMVRWMAVSYGAGASYARSVALISYTASPFFLAGVAGLYPLLWLDLLIGCAVACYSIALLYRGTAILMDIPPERGFLYASAVFAVALVSFVALLGTTVVLWDFGAAPEYTY